MDHKIFLVSLPIGRLHVLTIPEEYLIKYLTSCDDPAYEYVW